MAHRYAIGCSQWRESDGREIKKRQGAETEIERERTSKQEPNRPV